MCTRSVLFAACPSLLSFCEILLTLLHPIVRSSGHLQARRRLLCFLRRGSPMLSFSKARLTDIFPFLPTCQNHYSHFTPLARLLFENRITNLTIVGLALDYCVRYTVLDARKFGLEVEVWRAGTKAVDAAAEEKVLGEFRRKGVEVRE